MSSRHITESSSPPRSAARKPAMFIAESATPSRMGAATAVAASSTGSTPSSASSGSSRTMHQLPQANAQGGSGAPAAPAVSTSGSASSVGDARRSSSKNAALDGATAHRSSHHRVARDSCADTEGSGSAAGTITTATAATASISARHVTPAAAGSPSSDQAVHQQQQQQQQRGMISSTATPPTSSRASHHSDEDVARVRAALAEAGYPNHSWGDIERVFAQLSVNHNDGAGNAAAEHRETAPTPPAAHLSRRVLPEGMAEEEHREVYYQHNHSAVTTSPTVSPLQQRQQGGCPTESSTLLHYLDPSLRLQRYIQLRERELEELCLRPSLGATRPPQQQPSSTVPAAHARGTALSHGHDDAPSASRVKATTVRGATGQRAGKQQPRRRGGGGAVGASAAAPRDPQVRVTAAHYRRAANIVFDATGDQRFRFFPTTRTPQGTGTLLTSMPVPRTSPSSASTTALTGVAAARSGVPVSSLGSYHNYYQCPRPNSCGTVGGQVSYLDPEGRTLRRKADPVKRGEQMRLLWAKDSFLSQRGRPREAWRTRQITMAYAQDADGGAMHDG
ncbi:hypothetical protein LSCM4_08377 [Leishmania orientalis]|uniref:Uncharacterized protein n=1 Tax=Leishmania orientalis TaxID=2249476 RepID=A0A836KV54_9TRYP|nr:hypothetical protein LSCM4_08377 [Leishmania orientalis]